MVAQYSPLSSLGGGQLRDEALQPELLQAQFGLVVRGQLLEHLLQFDALLGVVLRDVHIVLLYDAPEVFARLLLLGVEGELAVLKPVDDEKDIFAADASHQEDMPLLLDAARKAVAHGNKVYILPNSKGIRTADFIFENKGVYKMYDLKTIHGSSSVMNRLIESIGQTTHVLLNITSNYRAISLAICIKKYFEANPNALEVMVFKGNKSILVKRSSTQRRDFSRTFEKLYNK